MSQDLFSKKELDVISASCNVVLELGVAEGAIDSEDEEAKDELLTTMINLLMSYKMANAMDREIRADEVCEVLGTYAKIEFRKDLTDRQMEEHGLYLALLLTDVNQFEDVANATTSIELINIFNSLEDRDDDDMKRIAVLRQAHDVLDEEGIEEFFAGVSEE